MENSQLENDIDELNQGVESLKKRIKSYDWEYRLSRFDEKIRAQKEETIIVLSKIRLSETNQSSDDSLENDWPFI